MRNPANTIIELYFNWVENAAKYSSNDWPLGGKLIPCWIFPLSKESISREAREVGGKRSEKKDFREFSSVALGDEWEGEGEDPTRRWLIRQTNVLRRDEILVERETTIA